MAVLTFQANLTKLFLFMYVKRIEASVYEVTLSLVASILDVSFSRMVVYKHGRLDPSQWLKITTHF